MNNLKQVRKSRGTDYVELRGHQGKITAVAFSSDGKTILTGSWDNTVRLWNVRNGMPVGPPLLHEDKVEAVAFECQGEKFWTGTRAGSVRSWEQAALCKHVLPHRGVVWGAAFSPDDKTLVTGTVLRGEKGEVRIWDALTGKDGWCKQQPHPVVTVAFSPDGKTILTGSGSPNKKWGEIRLLHAATGTRLDKIPLQKRAIKGVLFHPNGKFFVTSCADGTVQLWDTVKVRDQKTEKPFLELEKHLQGVGAVALSPDARLLATGGEDKTALLWNAETGAFVRPFFVPQVEVCGVAFSPDSQTTVIADFRGDVRLFKSETGKPSSKRILNHDTPVWSIAVSPNGKLILTGSGDDSKAKGEARLWDWDTLKPLGPPLTHFSTVSRVAFNAKGDQFLTGSYDGNVRIWDVPSSSVQGDVERIVLWTQVITGQQLDDQGNVRVLDERTWQQRRQSLSELGGPPVP
jgi:WD40 repeat protein